MATLCCQCLGIHTGACHRFALSGARLVLAVKKPWACVPECTCYAVCLPNSLDKIERDRYLLPYPSQRRYEREEPRR